MSRNIPKFKFQPIPTNLRKRRRVTPQQYARFYANYETKVGKIKRSSCQVKVDPNKNHEVLRRLIKYASERMGKRNQIPLCKNGHVFDDFGDFLHGVPWIRVRRVRSYKAGMHYEK